MSDYTDLKDIFDRWDKKHSYPIDAPIPWHTPYYTLQETVIKRPGKNNDDHEDEHMKEIKETAKDDCSLAPAIQEQIDALADLLARKGADYGGSAFESPTLAPLLSSKTSILVRMSDKINRLQTLAVRNANWTNYHVKDETFDDTIRDLAGYCILYLAANEKKEEIL